MVSDPLGFQGGKGTISSLKKQSNSLLIHPAIIDKCHWCFTCYRNRATNIKKPKKNPISVLFSLF